MTFNKFKYIAVLILSLILISCSNEDANKLNAINEAVKSGLETTGASEEEVEEVTSGLKEVTGGLKEVSEMIGNSANELNIPISELEEMVFELSLMEAHKNEIGIEEYLETIESDGMTAFEVQKQLADTLGMTLVELYNYQVYNQAPLTQEQKENNAKISNALDEISNIDLTGITTNTNSGEYKDVRGDIEELLNDRAYEIIEKEDFDNFVIVSYLTNDTLNEAVAYFEELLSGTKDYIIVTDETSSLIMGTINDSPMSVSIEMVDRKVTVEYCYDK